MHYICPMGEIMEFIVMFLVTFMDLAEKIWKLSILVRQIAKERQF